MTNRHEINIIRQRLSTAARVLPVQARRDFRRFLAEMSPKSKPRKIHSWHRQPRNKPRKSEKRPTQLPLPLRAFPEPAGVA